MALMTAITFASCASHDSSIPNDSTSQSSGNEGKAVVGFEAYTHRGVTRSGKSGVMDISNLRASQEDGGGFGVFAYYTDLKKYDQTYIPNFMYNQGVFDTQANKNKAANWVYTPIMYWPNEYGTDAVSDDEDKVSFFAYAPYVEATPASGSVKDATYGITGFTRNTTVGDPLVKYVSTFDTNNTVDLCWGVCDETIWNKIQDYGQQDMPMGLPWLNVERPLVNNQKLKFTFKHALTQLNVRIATSLALDANTKVYVRSISFTGIASKGALNLNNTERDRALWLDYSGASDLPYGQSVTVKDGRRDGREGSDGAEAKNENPVGLNPNIVQNYPATSGVTNTYQNLFNPTATIVMDDPENPTADELTALAEAQLSQPIYVIPTGEPMTVSIVYDVETESRSLTTLLSDGVTHGSSVENRISKTVNLIESGESGLVNGKKYTLNLYLGMNTVQFDAVVDDWDESNILTTVELPSNSVTGLYIVDGNNTQTQKLVMVPEESKQLYTINRPNYIHNTTTWKSSDNNIATVSDGGLVTAVGDGEVTITATNTVTGKTAQCKILVTHALASAQPNRFDADSDPGDVGKIIAKNGLLYTLDQADYYGISESDRIAIVGYVGSAGSADESSATYKGLAISLKDVNDGERYAYSTVRTKICATSYNTDINENGQDDYDDEIDTSIFYNCKSGIETTDLLYSHNTDHTHPVAIACKEYDVDISGISNISGWFFPSIGQWNLVLKALLDKNENIPFFIQGYLAEEMDDDYRTEAVNKIMIKSGTTFMNSHYWTFPEKDARYTKGIAFTHGAIGGGTKTGANPVRPFFAF